MRVDGGSIAWLVAVAIAFALAVLLFTPFRMALDWDEVVYASQISQHVPIMPWLPQRARGLPLLVAPVTLLTGSTVVLRVYLTLLAGMGLFLALLAWRGLRPTWVLALAGAVFGGLWLAQSQASRLYPNYWLAVGGLAAVGLFLQGWMGATPLRRTALLLASVVAFSALMHPPDAVFLVVPLLAAAIGSLARRIMVRRSAALLIAIIAGLAVGCGEWVVEAYMYFKGPAARLRATSQAVGGTRFNPVNNLRLLSAATSNHGWDRPGLLFWWLVFVVLVVLGIYVTRRGRGWLFAAAPAACALSIYALYTLPARDEARYMLPAWALLALPAADGIAWLVLHTKGRIRLVAVALTASFLAVELGTQHVALANRSAALEAAARANINVTNALHQLGIHSPCIITSVRRGSFFVPSSEPAAYYLGCAYEPLLRHSTQVRGMRVVVLVRSPGRPMRLARHWHAYKLGNTAKVVAYIGPSR
jgi:hypothetical protein